MTLYELQGAYLQLQEMAESGEFDPGELDDTIEGIEGELEDKADGYAKVIANINADIKVMDAQIAALKEEIDRMKKRKEAMNKNIERMKERLSDAMRATGKLKFKTQLFSFGIRKPGGVKKMIVTDELLEIPEEYIVTKAEADTAKIREALESGEKLSFAYLEEKEEKLMIK